MIYIRFRCTKIFGSELKLIILVRKFEVESFLRGRHSCGRNKLKLQIQYKILFSFSRDSLFLFRMRRLIWLWARAVGGRAVMPRCSILRSGAAELPSTRRTPLQLWSRSGEKGSTFGRTCAPARRSSSGHMSFTSVSCLPSRNLAVKTVSESVHPHSFLEFVFRDYLLVDVGLSGSRLNIRNLVDSD